MWNLFPRRSARPARSTRQSTHRLCRFEDLENRTLMSVTPATPAAVISANTEWKTDVVLGRDLVVNPGVTLTIDAGVKVSFQNSALPLSVSMDHVDIHVFGNLKVLGASNNPAIIRGNATSYLSTSQDAYVPVLKSDVITVEAGGSMTASNTQFLNGCYVVAAKGGTLNLNGGLFNGTVNGNNYPSAVAFCNGSSGGVHGFKFGNSMLEVCSDVAISGNSFTGSDPIFAGAARLGFLKDNSFDAAKPQTVHIVDSVVTTPAEWSPVHNVATFELDGPVCVKKGGSLTIDNGLTVACVHDVYRHAGFTVGDGGTLTINRAMLQGYATTSFSLSKVVFDGPIVYDGEGFPIPPNLGTGVYAIYSTLDVQNGGNVVLNQTIVDGSWQMQTAGWVKATGVSFSATAVTGGNPSGTGNPLDLGNTIVFGPHYEVLAGGRLDLVDSVFQGYWGLDVDGATSPFVNAGILTAKNTQFGYAAKLPAGALPTYFRIAGYAVVDQSAFAGIKVEFWGKSVGKVTNSTFASHLPYVTGNLAQVQISGDSIAPFVLKQKSVDDILAGLGL